MRRSGALGIFSNYRDGITLADLRVDEGDEGAFWGAHPSAYCYDYGFNGIASFLDNSSTQKKHEEATQNLKDEEVDIAVVRKAVKRGRLRPKKSVSSPRSIRSCVDIANPWMKSDHAL